MIHLHIMEAHISDLETSLGIYQLSTVEVRKLLLISFAFVHFQKQAA